jgi:hypothetical protein
MLTEWQFRYERSSIVDWFRTHNTSPKTGEVLQNTTLVPNHDLRSRVLAWQVQLVLHIIVLQCSTDTYSGTALGAKIIYMI